MFIALENTAFTMKWPSLLTKTKKYPFYEENSLVGLTPNLKRKLIYIK